MIPGQFAPLYRKRVEASSSTPERDCAPCGVAIEVLTGCGYSADLFKIGPVNERFWQSRNAFFNRLEK
jgi:hypothetical protein